MEPGERIREPPVAWHHEPPSTLVIVVLAPVAPAELPEMCERTGVLLEDTAATVLVCDIGIFERPCAVLMDALARLRLVTKRLDRSMHLRNASDDMRALFGLAGLTDVLPHTRAIRHARGQSSSKDL